MYIVLHFSVGRKSLFFCVPLFWTFPRLLIPESRHSSVQSIARLAHLVFFLLVSYLAQMQFLTPIQNEKHHYTSSLTILTFILPHS